MLQLKKNSLLVIVFGYSLLTFGQRKDLRSLDINTERKTKVKTFYTNVSEKSFNPKTTVYWTVKREIHSSQGDYSGHLLHGTYTEFYYNNQLFIKGQFKLGIRINEWKYWYKNGILEKSVNYKNGRIHGRVVLFNEHGKIRAIEKYKNGVRHGKFKKIINDTLSFSEKYKHGVIKVSKKNTFKPSLRIKKIKNPEKNKIPKTKNEKDTPKRKWKIPNLKIKNKNDKS